jgi:hypothetical protein
MSEIVLKMLLSELETIRVVCKHCGTASEIPIVRLYQQPGRSHGVRCPGCNISIRNAGDATGSLPPEDAFDQLAGAWQALDAMKGNFDIEFIIRQEQKPG